jgi:flagellar basal body-associated protein FliL
MPVEAQLLPEYHDDMGKASPTALNDVACILYNRTCQFFICIARREDTMAEQFGYNTARPTGGRKRRLWGILLLVIALLLLLVVAIGGYFYLNRSTPEKTLQTFCSALQQSNYHEAYDQLSASLQHTTNEQAFAAIFAQDKVTQCSYGVTSEFVANTTTSLQLVHASQKKNSDFVTLVKDESNIWRIADVYRA